MKATLMFILGQQFKKKKNILLEFYKQEFKQGCFMLLLLTFYNEEATYWSSEVKLNFCFLTNV